MNKYRAVKETVDGITFDSKAEARRYRELKLLERAKEIDRLELQPRFDLIVKGTNCGFYKADFAYRDTATGKRMVEDVKGVRTPIFVLKKKLVAAIHGVMVFEVGRAA